MSLSPEEIKILIDQFKSNANHSQEIKSIIDNLFPDDPKEEQKLIHALADAGDLILSIGEQLDGVAKQLDEAYALTDKYGDLLKGSAYFLGIASITLTASTLHAEIDSKDPVTDKTLTALLGDILSISTLAFGMATPAGAILGAFAVTSYVWSVFGEDTEDADISEFFNGIRESFNEVSLGTAVYNANYSALKLNLLFSNLIPNFNNNDEASVNAHSSLTSSSILLASGRDRESAYKSLLQSVADMMSISYSSEEDFYEKLKIADKSVISENAFLIDLYSYGNPGVIKYNATQSIAFRYALVEGNAFVIENADALYQSHAENVTLDLYVPGSGEQGLTDKYLQDRADYLFNLMEFRITNGTVYGNEFIEYHDKNGGDPVTIVKKISSTASKRIFFGSDSDDNLNQGGKNDDHFYGGKGDDVFIGNDGDDYFEGGEGADHIKGGKGNDAYFYMIGDGHDIIEDYDGIGEILLDVRNFVI